MVVLAGRGRGRSGRLGRACASVVGALVLVGVLAGCDQRPVLVEGQVTVGESDSPAGGVTVGLYDSAGTELLEETVTLFDGSYRLRMDPHGADVLLKVGEDAWWPGGTWGEAVPLALDGVEAFRADLNLGESAGSLSGFVVDGSGIPVGSALVSVSGEDGSRALVHTDGSGRFSVELASAGSYRMLVASVDPEHTSTVGGETPTVFEVNGGDQWVGTIDLTSGLPVIPPDPAGLVSTGYGHSCAVPVGEGVVCWGSDGGGQVSGAPVSGVFSSVAAGLGGSCALGLDGAIVCWGVTEGEVPSGSFVQVDAGHQFACGLRVDGEIVCWGVSSDGRLDVPEIGGYTSVSVGANHACGVAVDRSIRCWGHNGYGQAPDLVSGEFESVAAGYWHTCAVEVDGGVECWGENNGGQSSVPFGEFSAVAAGSSHSCGIRQGSGLITCWGRNIAGEMSAPPGEFVAIASFYRHSCAVRADGQVVCWGDTANGKTTPPGLVVPL